MCLCQLPFDPFPYYSNPDSRLGHLPLRHSFCRRGSPLASSNCHEKTAPLSSPRILQVAELFRAASGARPPSVFPEPASACSLLLSLLYIFCTSGGKQNVWGNCCVCFSLSCLCSVSLRTFLVLAVYLAFSLGSGG